MPNESDTAAQAAKKHQEAQRSLIQDYKRIPPSVIADLNHKFGFNRWAAQDTEDEKKIARRVFMQGPLFEIERMRSTNLGKPKQKPKRATTTHEQDISSPGHSG
jgi:hypothetical protein